VIAVTAFFRSLFKLQEQRIDLAPGRETMAQKTLTFVFGIVVAMAMTILTITTLAAPSKSEDGSPAPRSTIYRPDLWKVY
jgi:hypothetical protein